MCGRFTQHYTWQQIHAFGARRALGAAPVKIASFGQARLAALRMNACAAKQRPASPRERPLRR